MFLPKAAIFDLDGTLFDSMGIWKSIDAEFLRRRGHVCTHDYTDAIKAMGWQEGAEYTIARYGLSETPEEVIQAWFDMSEDFYMHKVPMKPFAKEYLLALREKGVPLAVATSMEPQANIGNVLRAHGISEFFQNVTVATEVTRGKGYPDIYALAASRLGVSPSDCAVFEDILVAIRGASAGGFQTVGIFDPVSEGDWPAICAESTLAVRSWEELL
ncbi:MAG: HAD family phosphatase [Clostridiales bacterium]|nr:HAD family phosphatase [Clostridiales bacterium]